MSSRLYRFLACCGNGDVGRLGHGLPLSNELWPRICVGLADICPQQVSCGGAHTVVLSDDGAVFSFGLNDMGQLGHSEDLKYVAVPRHVPLPDPAVQVAAGHSHTMCLLENGEVWSFGSNKHGQLGHGRRSPAFSSDPHPIRSLSGTVVQAVAAGARHSLAIDGSGGQLLAWGSNEQGQLGFATSGSWFGASRTEWLPRLVHDRQLTRINAVCAGSDASACVVEGGRAFSWGSPQSGILGQPAGSRLSGMPAAVDGLTRVSHLALGGLHGLAVQEGSAAFAWGCNTHGMLGFPEGFTVPQPRQLQDHFFKHVAAGWQHSAGTTHGGRLYTWGWGGTVGSTIAFDGSAESCGGQLGLGHEFDCWEPQHVAAVTFAAEGQMKVLQRIDSAEHDSSDSGDGPPSWKVMQVSCGLNHTAAIIDMEEQACPL